MYQVAEQSKDQRKWVNWKQVLICFAILGAPIPTEKDLGELRVKLSDEGQYITKEQFVKCPFWFDEFEGKPDSALEAKWLAEKLANQELSDYDSEDESNDQIK